MITAYLATPAVFRPDAKAYGEKLKAICSEYGINGVFPLDNECTNSSGIYRNNMFAIQDCDVILADVSPFRGPSLDVGVSFEIGYAMGLGKAVVAYNVPYSHYKTRVYIDQDGRSDSYDYDDWNVEDFCLTDNLMLARSYDFACRDIREALEWLKSKA